MKKKPSKPVDFISENTESKGTNEPATPTTSIKYAEDFISTRQGDITEQQRLLKIKVQQKLSYKHQKIKHL